MTAHNDVVSVVGIARSAQRAMLYEVVVHPKPGLVDPVDSGSHRDMDVFTFIDSSVALRGYFERAAQAGADFRDDNLPLLFERLRDLGRQAEREMFAATNGVNTHKGAVFSLGIAVGATAWWCREHMYDTCAVQRVIRQMLQGLSEHDFQTMREDRHPLTAGEKQFLESGRTGIRGEAEHGFPAVVDVALPFLRHRSGTLNERLLDTLMMLATVTQDSNLIKRAGNEHVLEWLKSKVDEYFSFGGACSERGIAFLDDLNAEFVQRNLSLGGCADLLILTIFFALLEGAIGDDGIDGNGDADGGN